MISHGLTIKDITFDSFDSIFSYNLTTSTYDDACIN
jgi:hypothetical protein